MTARIYITVILIGACVAIYAKMPLQHFDKPAFYQAMATSNVEIVDNELIAITYAPKKDQEAYEGALLMKKAGLAANSKNKLNLFKSGRNKLETVLAKDSTNAEWRFLRLMIQEHAPKILNYRREIDKDSQFISKSFKSLSPVVQQAVLDYSKKSKVLGPALLN